MGIVLFFIHANICSQITQPLLVVLVSLVVDDVEEAELVDALRRRDDAEPVAKLLLLQVLLRATPSQDPSANIVPPTRSPNPTGQTL